MSRVLKGFHAEWVTDRRRLLGLRNKWPHHFLLCMLRTDWFCFSLRSKDQGWNDAGCLDDCGVAGCCVVGGDGDGGWLLRAVAV